MKLGLTLALLALAMAGAALATPLACADPCVISGSLQGYNPPLAEIASGGSVVWTSPDVSHLNAEEGLLATESCFYVEYDPSSPSRAITFVATPSGLLASGDDARFCDSALALPDGSFEISYYCPLHPFTMRAALLVTPS